VEYLDVQYGQILKLSKTVPAKGNKTRQKRQVSVHWDDPKAIFFCRWYEPVVDSKGVEQLIDGCKAFTMPISCTSGLNWEIRGKDGMVLCPVLLERSNGVFLLNADHQKLAEEQAMAVTTSEDNHSEFNHVGPPKRANTAPVAPGTSGDVGTRIISNMRMTENDGMLRIVRGRAIRKKREVELAAAAALIKVADIAKKTTAATERASRVNKRGG